MLDKNSLYSEVRDQKSSVLAKAKRYIEKPQFSPSGDIPDFTKEIKDHFLSVFKVQGDPTVTRTEIDIDYYFRIFNSASRLSFDGDDNIEVTCINYPLEGDVRSDTMLTSIRRTLPRNIKLEDGNLIVYCQQADPKEEFVDRTREQIAALKKALIVLQEEMRNELETICSEIDEEVHKLIETEVRRREIQDKFKI